MQSHINQQSHARLDSLCDTEQQKIFNNIEQQLSLITKQVNELKQYSPRCHASPPNPVESESRYRVGRYNNTRYYALYNGDDLIAVTVYKKGANQVRYLLESYEHQIFILTHR